MPFVRLLALLSLFLLSAAPARAVDESDFCSSGDDPCVFSGSELNVPDNTELDFGSRTLVIGTSKRINITGGRTLSIIAGNFVMQTGARIGNVTATATGANVTVTTTGDIRLEKGGLESKSRIELPGTISGGSIQFTAGGSITVDGELRVNGIAADAPGGTIDLDAVGGVTIGALAPANLSGGLAELGGSFTVSADGPIVISGDVDASGGLGGGSIDISGLGSLTTTGTLDVRGRAAGSFGGELLIGMDGAVSIGGKVFALGVGAIVEGGGTGGEIDISAGASMLLNEVIDLSGGAPEGDGGFADFVAEVDIIQKRQVIAVGAGTGGSGGVVSFEAGRLLSLEALNDVGGSLAGGDFTGTARGEVQAKSDIRANGDGAGGSGGTVLLDGRVPGVAQVSGSITVSGAIRTRGDTDGGGVSLVGCNVTVTAPAALDNFGPGASNAILASGLMTILGNVRATPTGTNTLQFRDLDKQPVIPDPMLIDPFTPPTRNAALPGCEPPPPLICGNGEPTGVEGCDDGNLDSCDGCSGGTNPGPGANSCHTAAVPCCQAETCGNGRVECQTVVSPFSEVCDDGNVVDGDGCDSNCKPTGCGNDRVTTGEECDDGNQVSGDGCSSTCIVEPPPGCGDGVRSDDEECDDGNTVSCDATRCSKICVVETCGNGLQECAESCDDGGTAACDGECAADCSHEVACGDGTQECDERCDAGAQNGAPGSGCSAFCQTCTIGSGSDCPCETDFDCAPAGRCGGLACLSGACASVEVPLCNDGNACNGVEACVDGACTVPTPPACVDDDPCTDDTCNPTGGANPCPHARKTGFAGISCRLDFVVSRADGASVEELPTKLRAKILKLAGGARDRINQAASETNVKRQRKLLKSAEKQLGKLVKAINKGLAKGQIAEALGTRFAQEADGARGDARTLRAAITG